MLEIRLLGQFAVHLDDRPIELSSRAAQALLACLVLNAPRKQPRERLAGLLWPEADDDAARQGLRNALWKLRAAVGERHLVADKLTIGWADGAPWWSDVGELLDEAEGSDEALSRATERYAGELLPGFYEEWVGLERERLAAAFERKSAALVARLEAAGRWNEALAASERWLARAGAAEPAYRTLMRAYAALGDRAGVGAAYRRCVAALKEDLGLPPSEATASLYQSLLQEAAPPAPVPSEPGGAARRPAFLADGARGRPARPRPAAREAQLAALMAAVDAAASGEGRLVLVAGEAGEGKSTLLEALTEMALERHADLVVARGAADAFAGGGRAFGPFSDAFRLLAGDVEAAWTAGQLSTAHAQRLWALVPDVVGAVLGRGRPLLGTLIDAPTLARHAAAFAAAASSPQLAEFSALVAGAEPAGGRLEQAALFEACAEFLLALAQRRPLVLLLDDMHWMDAASAELLLHLSRRLAGARLLIVGAYRTEEAASAGAGLPLASWLGELQRIAGRITLPLGTPDEAAARAFVDALIDREPNALSEEFRAAVARQTRGHALFTVELLDDLKERGWLTRDAEGCWTAGAGLVPTGLPARVEGVLQSRFGRLDDELRQALAIGAVEGEEFTVEVVARVAGADAWHLLARFASEAAGRHRLLEELGPQRVGGRRLSRFRFRHHLFQRFLYEGLGPSVRPHLHEAIAEALAALHGPEASALAVSLSGHYLAAELPERALPHLLEAGRAANRLAAHQAASRHLEAALEALKPLPGGPERDALELDARLELAVALHVVKGFAAPAVAEHTRRAVALAEAAGDADRRFRALWNLWLHQVACYDARASRAVAEELLAAAGDDPVRTLQAHHAAWSACHLVGEHERGRRHLAAAAPLYDESRHGELMAAYGGHDPGVCRLVYAARASLLEGGLEKARGLLDEALALARRLGHAYGVSQALLVRCEVCLEAGDFAGAIALADEAAVYASEHGFPFWRSYALLFRGWAQAWLGRPEGLAAVRAFLAEHAEGLLEASPTLRAYEASAYLALGRTAEGLAAVEAGLAAVERSGEASAQAELHRLRAELAFLQEGAEPAGAEADWERAAAIAEECGNLALAYRAVSALAGLWRGGPREAEGVARSTAARERLSEPPPPTGMTRFRRATSDATRAGG